MAEIHEFANDAGLLALVRSQEGVTALRFIGESVSAEAIGQLVASPLWAKLDALDLTWSNLSPSAFELLSTAPATQLRSLNLSANSIELAQLAALADAAWFPALEKFELCEAELEDDGLRALVAHMTQLRELDLSINSITAKGVQALAASSLPEHLVGLDVFANWINEEGAQALASVRWPELRKLHISGNELGDSGVHALMTSTAFPGLEVLRASSNGATSAGITRGLEQCTLTGLKTLGLATSNIDAEAAGALAECPALEGLKQLDISSNRELSDTGLQQLAGAAGLSSLTQFKCEFCDLTDEQLMPVLQARWPLGGLSLSSNHVGLDGVTALVESHYRTTLHSLNLCSSGLDDESLSILRAETNWPALRELDLSENAITPEGWLALLTWPPLEHLEYLVVSLDDADADADLFARLRERCHGEVWRT